MRTLLIVPVKGERGSGTIIRRRHAFSLIVEPGREPVAKPPRERSGEAYCHNRMDFILLPGRTMSRAYPRGESLSWACTGWSRILVSATSSGIGRASSMASDSGLVGKPSPCERAAAVLGQFEVPPAAS